MSRAPTLADQPQRRDPFDVLANAKFSFWCRPQGSDDNDPDRGFVLAPFCAEEITRALDAAGFVIVPKDVLVGAKGEIEWWASEHGCCNGHQDEVVASLTAAIGGKGA